MTSGAQPARGEPDAAEMATTLVLILLVSCALSGVSLLADLTSDSHRGIELGLTALGCGFAAALFALRRHATPVLLSRVAVPAAIAQLSFGIYLSGDPANPAAALYGLVAPYSFYFFSRRTAIAQLGVAGVAYALALAPLADLATGFDRWMFVLGAAGAAGVVAAGVRGRLVTQAGTDWLTGLANRRGFEERSARELSRVRRDRTPLTLVLVDIDHFKAVNDRSGHEAGDRALLAVAKVLSDSVRRHDLVARLGGDEFGVLLVGGDERAARKLSARVLRALAPSGLTVSSGAAMAASCGYDATRLGRAADAALYTAKRAGRGQLAVAGD